MEYERFVATVEQEAGIPRPRAERAVRATLETLGERISGGEARDVAEQLPQELRPALVEHERNPQAFHLDEFLRRVAEREGVAPPDAEQDVRAVFAALGYAVSDDELADMASELPKDFAELVALARSRAVRARPMGTLPSVRSTEEFVQRVSDGAGLDRDRARRAIDATLETLGERIARGEVEDLAAQLPDELCPPLQRGDELSNGAARPLSLPEFVRLVAEREGATPEEAREHARVVFATLRDTVTEREFSDMAAQLPDGFAALLARP